MSKVCQVSKKRYNNANKVCFSNKHHKHKQYPNVQVKRFWDAEQGRWVRLRVSTKVIRTIAKHGLRATLKRYSASQSLLVV